MQKRSFLRLLAVLIFITPLTFSSLLFSQDTEAMKILNLLAFGGVGELRYKIGGEPGGESVNLDDSDWELTFPGFKWKESNTNVWFRSGVNIPEKIGGFSLIGRKMTLFLYIDNGGEVFVNGDSLGSFEWGTAEFVISEELQAGDNFLIAVRGINRPGWGKVSEYRIEFSGMVDFQKKVQDKVWGLMIARRVAGELSEKPDHWIKQINKVAHNIIESQAFIDGDEQGFLAEFDKQGKLLQDLKAEVQDKYHLFGAGYSHIDLAWQWPWVETVEVLKNTTESVLNIMKRFPDFKYSMGQAHAYEWMENYYPGLFREIQEKVKQGKWEIVGGQWCEPDGNLPSGESFVRQSLYAKRYFREKFGVDVKECWIPDSFGFNWNLPQILARSGIEAFITIRVDPNDTRNFPHRLFWWQAPDGSKVMTYIPRDGYMHDLNGEQLVDFIAEEKNELNIGKELVLYGVGNHGGGPTMEMLERARRAQIAPAFPDLQLTGSHEFFNSLTKKERSKLPTWDSELYLERFRGCYTSQAKTKKHNREGQVLIKNAEKLASIARQYGYEYPKEKIFNVWRTILFNQFHDVLPGTSINAVTHDTEREYAQAEKIGGLVTKRAFEFLAQKIDTRGPGTPLIIFNPHSWTRNGPVKLLLDDLDMDKEWRVLDLEGNEIAVQKIEESVISKTLLFMAKNIPPYGYSVYRLVEQKPGIGANHLKFNRSEMENTALRVKIDKISGLIAEIYDRVNNRQVLVTPKGNILQILEDDAHDAWNMRFSKEPLDLDRAREVTLEEFGPVRATIKVVHAFVGDQKKKPTEDFPSSFFTQYISLYDGLPYVEVRNDVMWWEEHKVLKVGFPVDVYSKVARYEIPYSSIERPTGFETPFEKARYEVPAQRWADLSDGNYGVTLINDCKHGYDIKGNNMRLTLLRAPTDPDPMADKGYHSFKYALYPHKGDFVEGQVVRRGLEFNEPLMIIKANSHKGILPTSHSFIKVTPETVVLNALKIAEDDNDWIVRIYESSGKQETVTVSFDRQIVSVTEVNLIEDIINKIKPSGRQFSFIIKPNEIRSFKVGLLIL
jgi:alpha-mannosidase